MADRTRTLLSDDELFSLVKQADPLAKRIPPGVRAIADAIYTAANPLLWVLDFKRITSKEKPCHS